MTLIPIKFDTNDSDNNDNDNDNTDTDTDMSGGTKSGEAGAEECGK